MNMDLGLIFVVAVVGRLLELNELFIKHQDTPALSKFKNLYRFLKCPDTNQTLLLWQIHLVYVCICSFRGNLITIMRQTRVTKENQNKFQA